MAKEEKVMVNNRNMNREDKLKALDAALTQIEKADGKGSGPRGSAPAGGRAQAAVRRGRRQEISLVTTRAGFSPAPHRTAALG